MHNPFDELEREATPPPALRDRVAHDLRQRGLLRPRARALTLVWRAAAAVALMALGAAASRMAMTSQREPQQISPSGASVDSVQFALLLYEPSTFDTTRSHSELAAEYGAWARSLTTRFVAGEALGEERTIGGEMDASGSSIPTGFFIIRTADWDSAMSIASTCPHLRYGGIVAVRRIL